MNSKFKLDKPRVAFIAKAGGNIGLSPFLSIVGILLTALQLSAWRQLSCIPTKSKLIENRPSTGKPPQQLPIVPSGHVISRGIFFAGS